MRAAVAVLALVACTHAPPKATVMGKRVGLGELRGDAETKSLMKDALLERFELTEEQTAELHLHADVTMSGYDEPVMNAGPVLSPQAPSMPRLYRRVETMRATLRLVNDGTSEEVAVGVYEVMEKGPERPMGSRGGDELGIILARRVVRLFIDEKKL
jgi:hypothetical protein